MSQTRGPALIGPSATLTVVAAVFVIGVLWALPSIGPSGEAEAVRSFLKAAAERDGRTACASLTAQGRAVVAGYGRPGGTPASASFAECARAIQDLDRRPRADDWAAMAEGKITAEGAGWDTGPVTVTYRREPGVYVQSASGSAQPGLLSPKIWIPPTPAP